MSTNLYKEFSRLIPEAPLLVGTVQAVGSGEVVIELPDGGITKARGGAVVGNQVWFRDGVIEGVAPSLPVEIIEV